MLPSRVVSVSVVLGSASLLSTHVLGCSVFVIGLIPDDGLKVFLRAFPVVHSCAMQTYSGMPDVFTGTRVVKVTLAKNLPSAARVSGFDVWLWYQG